MNRLWALFLALCLTASCRPEPEHVEETAEAEAVRGPHGGRVLEDDDFAIELAIFESGVPPEFHAWATVDGQPLPPADVALTVELARLGGARDRIEFVPVTDYLRGTSVVHEPHSFDVSVTARRAGREHRWQYPAYEGRTTIAAPIASASGIQTAAAGPGTIVDRLVLYGTIAPDIARVRQVQARFPGVIRSVTTHVGDRVRAGDALATVESNESLRTYTVPAPIAGVVTARHAEPGEQTDADGLFEIADFSTVWAELDVFSRDRPRVRQGAAVRIDAGDGAPAAGTIDYLSPIGDRASQSVTARVVLDNADGRFTPGEFVEAQVTVAETPVALAVPVAALQTFRELDVVFARVGDVYEVRMLTLGRRDGATVEVLEGLEPGTEIVTAGSYLVKADIEKAGASHDH